MNRNIEHVHICANNMLINKPSYCGDLAAASFQENPSVHSFSSTVKDVLESRITSWFTLGWSDCFLGIAAPNPPPPQSMNRGNHIKALGWCLMVDKPGLHSLKVFGWELALSLLPYSFLQRVVRSRFWQLPGNAVKSVLMGERWNLKRVWPVGLREWHGIV